MITNCLCRSRIDIPANLVSFPNYKFCYAGIPFSDIKNSVMQGCKFRQF
jgi:hypothetical protein